MRGAIAPPGRCVMRLVGLALAGLLIGVTPAFAQYAPRPPVPIGPMAADDVAEIVQAMGLDPVGHPARSGPFYVQHAMDGYGRTLRVTVDARRSQVIAVEAAGAVRAPYGTYAGYPYRRPYAGHVYGDFDLTPPGSVMGSRAQPHALPPPSVAQPRPATKSAAVAPQHPPVPRKRPAGAPAQASAGSAEPVPPAAQAAPVVPAPEKPEPPKPAAPALTPVAPLE
jgi:hypothetical protein